MKKLLTLFTLLLTVCSGAWGTDLEIPLTNLKNFPLDYGLVTITNTNDKMSIASNQLQASKVTGTFRVSTKIAGVYLKSISFTDANSSKNGGFTCTDNASYMPDPVNNVYTYTAPNTTTTEANFQLIGSGGTAKLGTIIITVSTSDQVERLTGFGSISNNKIPFTSSAATTNVELSIPTPTSNGVSAGSNKISIGSGGKHLIVSTKNDKVIKKIAIPKYQQSTYPVTGASDPEGTYSSDAWTPSASDVTSVDLTLTVSSTVYSQEIYVIYEDAAPTTPTLTGAWKIGDDEVTSANVVQGGSATIPTFTVGATSGTPDADDYTVTYSLKDGSATNIFTFTESGGPTEISTANVGTATLVATLASVHTEEFEDADPNTFEYTVTVNAPATPITLAWDKSSDIVATNSVVTAPVFSNNGGLEVNTTNFNFAITGTEGIISVADNGVVTIDSSVKGEATVTASVKASGYSATPVAYTIRVADAATKWDFTSVSKTVDEYNLSADAAGDGILWTYDSSNNRYKNKYDSENHTDLIPTANSNYLTVAEGLLLSWDAADRFRIDIKGKRAWANGGAVIKITNLKAGQKVSVRHKASGDSNYPRGFETSNLSNTSDFSLNNTDEHTATGYVTADGTVTLTAQGGGTYLYTITVEDYVPVTVSDAKYATFASDSKLDFTGVTGLSAYTATAEGTTITFNQVTGSVPAGEGLLLYADVNENTTYYVPVATGSTSPVDNLLKRGTGAPLTYAEGTAEYYILANETAGIGFYKANNNTVAKNRAYLDLTNTNAKSFVLPGGETDGIRSIENGELRTENSDYYNLAGQRVGKDYKGIVIVNGKKMLNK